MEWQYIIYIYIYMKQGNAGDNFSHVIASLD